MQKNSNKHEIVQPKEWIQALLKKDYIVLFMVIIGMVLDLNKTQTFNWYIILIPILVVNGLYLYLTERLQKKW